MIPMNKPVIQTIDKLVASVEPRLDRSPDVRLAARHEIVRAKWELAATSRRIDFGKGVYRNTSEQLLEPTRSSPLSMCQPIRKKRPRPSCPQHDWDDNAERACGSPHRCPCAVGRTGGEGDSKTRTLEIWAGPGNHRHIYNQAASNMELDATALVINMPPHKAVKNAFGYVRLRSNPS